MFARFFRPLWNKIRSPRTLLNAAAIFTYSLYRNRILLDSPINEEPLLTQEQIKSKNFNQYVKQLRTIDVCDGKDLLENQRKIVTVTDINGVELKIMITRMQGSLYAFLATCPHQQPFSPKDQKNSLEKAVLFTDKLYCPHHGCIFDIKSGSIEHGPAIYNLPIFFAQEVNGVVQLMYPLAVPTSVAPNSTQKDVEDLSKAVILGDDDAAAIGCINSLRQFGYQGQITVARQGTYEYPFKKEYLHKKLLNLHLQQPETMNQVEQSHKKRTENQKKSKVKNISLGDKINKYIDEQLQQKIYSKLQYFDENWYKNYGIDFVFNDEPYRIINKQYYPYITFADGTKLEYDVLMVATGVVPKIPMYQGITTNEQKDSTINLPENVFCPFRSKDQHIKINKFLNKNVIKSLLVLGYNMESLEFVQALKEEFPHIKVTVIDNQPNSSVSQLLGPDLQKAIAKEFTSKKVQFFIKVRDQLLFSNKFSKNNIEVRKEEQKLKRIQALLVDESKDNKSKDNKNKDKSNDKKKNSPQNQITVADPKLKYIDSITTRISDDIRIKADGAVLFPTSYQGNLQWVRNGKYTDFDYFHNNRLGGDTFNRTENIRIFSAGLSSANEYFLMSNKRLVTFDPTTCYEQGFNIGLNMQALRIPFTYVPYQKFQFFDKKLLYIGSRDFFDSVLIMGSIQNWDFLAVYGLGSQVKGVSGSPSRGRQLCIMREALRVNCMPTFDDFVSGYWTVQNLSKLIRKINKSGCYRDIIFQNRENIHMKDLLWMQRTADAGFENDRPQNTQDNPSQQVGADGKLKNL